MQKASVYGEAKIDTPASSAWVSASIAGVGRHVRRHRERQPRLDDRDVGHQRVVDQRQLAAPGGQDGGGRDLRARTSRRRHGGEADRVVDVRVVGDALAGVEERQRQLCERQLGALMEEPHRLGGVEHGAAADGDDQVRLELLEHLDAGAHLLLRGLGLDLGEHAHGAADVPPDLVGHAAGLGVGVGDEQRLRRLDAAQLLQRAGVEVGVGRDAEPLRRRLAPRHRLHVEQVAVVDVLGRDRPSPRAAAERERRGHRVVDAAERADRGRRVDEDAARAHGDRERVDHRSRRRRRRPRCGPCRRCRARSRRRGRAWSTDGERTSPSTGISFSCTSGWLASASRSDGSGASRTLSSGSASKPARPPSAAHELAERRRAPAGRRRRRTTAASADDLVVGEQPRAHALELGEHARPRSRRRRCRSARRGRSARSRTSSRSACRRRPSARRRCGGRRRARCRRRRSGRACRRRWPRRPPSARRWSR